MAGLTKSSIAVSSISTLCATEIPLDGASSSGTTNHSLASASSSTVLVPPVNLRSLSGNLSKLSLLTQRLVSGAPREEACPQVHTFLGVKPLTSAQISGDAVVKCNVPACQSISTGRNVAPSSSLSSMPVKISQSVAPGIAQKVDRFQVIQPAQVMYPVLAKLSSSDESSVKQLNSKSSRFSNSSWCTVIGRSPLKDSVIDQSVAGKASLLRPPTVRAVSPPKHLARTSSSRDAVRKLYLDAHKVQTPVLLKSDFASSKKRLLHDQKKIAAMHRHSPVKSVASVAPTDPLSSDLPVQTFSVARVVCEETLPMKHFIEPSTHSAPVTSSAYSKSSSAESISCFTDEAMPRVGEAQLGAAVTDGCASHATSQSQKAIFFSVPQGLLCFQATSSVSSDGARFSFVQPNLLSQSPSHDLQPAICSSLPSSVASVSHVATHFTDLSTISEESMTSSRLSLHRHEADMASPRARSSDVYQLSTVSSFESAYDGLRSPLATTAQASIGSAADSDGLPMPSNFLCSPSTSIGLSVQLIPSPVSSTMLVGGADTPSTHGITTATQTSPPSQSPLGQALALTLNQMQGLDAKTQQQFLARLLTSTLLSNQATSSAPSFSGNALTSLIPTPAPERAGKLPAGQCIENKRTVSLSSSEQTSDVSVASAEQPLVNVNSSLSNLSSGVASIGMAARTTGSQQIGQASSMSSVNVTTSTAIPMPAILPLAPSVNTASLKPRETTNYKEPPFCRTPNVLQVTRRSRELQEPTGALDNSSNPLYANALPVLQQVVPVTHLGPFSLAMLGQTMYAVPVTLPSSIPDLSSTPALNLQVPFGVALVNGQHMYTVCVNGQAIPVQAVPLGSSGIVDSAVSSQDAATMSEGANEQQPLAYQSRGSSPPHVRVSEGDAGSVRGESSPASSAPGSPSSRSSKSRFVCEICGKEYVRPWSYYAHLREHAEGAKGHTCEVCGKAFAYASLLKQHYVTHTGEKQFPCSACGKGFTSPSSLRVHELSHGGERSFVCKAAECGKVFSNAGALRLHQRIHSGDKPYICAHDGCDKSFKTPSELTRHEYRHTGEKPHQCDQCDKSFVRKDDLKRHYFIHTGQKPFKCDLCDFSCIQSFDLVKHKYTHGGDKPYKCQLCPRQFTRPARLREHLRLHTGEKPFSCDECGKNFTHQTSLKSHKMTHSGQKPNQCSMCDKAFAFTSDLRAHMMSHSGLKPFHCVLCGKEFVSSKTLKRHAIVHSGEKPFKCPFCGKEFARASDLKVHEPVHHKEKPYRCDQCEKTFTRFSSLREHRRTHTGEFPFKCDFCDKVFNHRSHLNVHVRTHTGERPHKCHLCARDFPRKSSLRYHLRRHGIGDVEGALPSSGHVAEAGDEDDSSFSESDDDADDDEFDDSDDDGQVLAYAETLSTLPGTSKRKLDDSGDGNPTPKKRPSSSSQISQVARQMHSDGMTVSTAPVQVGDMGLVNNSEISSLLAANPVLITQLAASQFHGLSGLQTLGADGSTLIAVNLEHLQGAAGQMVEGFVQFEGIEGLHEVDMQALTAHISALANPRSDAGSIADRHLGTEAVIPVHLHASVNEHGDPPVEVDMQLDQEAEKKPLVNFEHR